MSDGHLRLGLVGPLPPPSGGMANQTRQLGQLLQGEGVAVQIVRTNEPYRPAWVGRIRGLRALFRLIPYRLQLRRTAGEVQVMHVMANSGWAWFLLAVPAIRAAARVGVPVVINYRGGLAREFLAKSAARIRSDMRLASAVIVPSRFLQSVFAEHGIRARIIPNIVNLEVFKPASAPRQSGPHVVVTRNLEAIYGVDVAIRAVALLRREFPQLRMSVAGSGPSRESLEGLVRELGLTEAVRFTGRLEVADIAALYRDADIVLNSSRADNTPNSLLEGAASGVPIVSTDVGGVPYLLEHRRTAWLVSPDDPAALAAGVATVLRDEPLRQRLRENGLALAASCAWSVVRAQWLGLYAQLTPTPRGNLEPVVVEE
jgi:glycosyltransferase involved in cell wall biosynthesis